MGGMMGPEGDLHPQISVSLMAKDVFVDVEMGPLLEALGHSGIKTYESCQNYGEYLRFMELDHVFEAKRDYAYIEFYRMADALAFIQVAKDSGVQSPIHHRSSHEGTPDAWELKIRMTTGRPWVWFPNYDIEEVTKLVSDHVIEEEMALD